MTRLVIIICLLAGCTGTRPDPPNASSITANRDLAFYAPFWEREASKRFKDPLVFMCHGVTDHLTGQWVCVPDRGPRMPVEGLALFLSSLFPDRPIVLVVCNEDGHALRVARVWYSRQVVWAMPDAFTRQRHEPGAGSIWEFMQ